MNFYSSKLYEIIHLARSKNFSDELTNALVFVRVFRELT